jgi:hypothetical protein
MEVKKKMSNTSKDKNVKKLEDEGEKAKVIRKPKAKTEKEPNIAKFPVNSKINPYGFIFMKKSWLESLGWTKGIALQVDKNADDSITVRRA